MWKCGVSSPSQCRSYITSGWMFTLRMLHWSSECRDQSLLCYCPTPGPPCPQSLPSRRGTSGTASAEIRKWLDTKIMDDVLHQWQREAFDPRPCKPEGCANHLPFSPAVHRKQGSPLACARPLIAGWSWPGTNTEETHTVKRQVNCFLL